jgi:DNA-binding CsgD family transcriptional regulator
VGAGTVVFGRALDAVERVCETATDADEVFEGVAEEMRKVVPFDSSMWFGVDPGTLLATSPSRVEGLYEGHCEAFWEREFHEQDASLWVDLARSPVPAAALRASLDDRPARSIRYREFMQPHGFSDELRGVFRTGDSAWGIFGVFREHGRPPFTDDDVKFVGAISATVAVALRRHAAGANPWHGVLGSPGVLLFDADGALLSANEAAVDWLVALRGDDHLAGEAPPAGWADILCDECSDLDVPTPIYPLLARARAYAHGRERSPARLRVRDRKGRWLLLHASALHGSSGDTCGGVALVVEPAKSADIAPIIIEAYGLSPRERDVVRLIAQGASTQEMAAALFLSQHTVRDYVKAVFEKVGVSSRGELVAKLFAEHYSGPMHDTLVHV